MSSAPYTRSLNSVSASTPSLRDGLSCSAASLRKKLPPPV
jgi:hypothetical protein